MDERIVKMVKTGKVANTTINPESKAKAAAVRYDQRWIDEMAELVKKGYKPSDYYQADEELKAVVDWVGSNYFTPTEPPGVLSSLRDNLIHNDPFLVLADFRAYSDAQQLVDAAYRNKAAWAKMAILNTARMGKFSSDRTIKEYAKEIWNVEPIEI